MKILGIDYGRRKIGIAIGDTDSRLAEPHSVVRVRSMEGAVRKVVNVVEVEKVEKVVLGISEGEVGKESRQFGEILAKKCGVTVEYEDETLTTKEAQRLAIEAGIGQKKRKAKEDAYSAALILQSYLDGLS